nr:DUF2207 domain-containing protein [Sphingomicrobium aestuariivivum]
MALAAPAAAQERILAFHAHADVREDGSAIITETIRVQAEGNRIKRGIFRTIPIRYRDKTGRTVNVGFDFLAAERDGRREEYQVTRQANGARIRLGSADHFLSDGVHEYRLRYRIKRAIGRFEEFDELYWNVTGNGWEFPIDRSSATIRLPKPADLVQYSSYTGRQGEQGTPARLDRAEPGVTRFEYDRRLAPGEGLTVAVAFPKGVVAPLSTATKFRRQLADVVPPVAGLLGLLLVAAYYLHAWRTVGRDPRPGTVVPLFAPPDDLSPAAIRYLTRQSMDYRGMTAALVDSAIKGHVELREEGGGFFKKPTMEVHRLVDGGQLRPLDEGEHDMLAQLALPGASIAMDNDNHKEFSAARKMLERPYEKRYDGTAFHRNIGWAVAGLLFWFAGIWIAAAGVVWAEEMASPLLVLLSVAGVLIGTLLFFGRPEQGQMLRWPVIILAAIIGLAGLIPGIPFALLALGSGNVLPVLLPLIGGGIIAFSGFFWMDAPTLEGRALLDRIAGFKQYLATTEEERFDRMQPPRAQLQLFERYLPHAIALEVENRWAERFEGVLAAAAANPSSDRDNSFLWYSGTRDIWSNPGSFATAIGSTMTSTIASAATAPGSSSGSGGGGFSGGGVGGGGGGGW